MSCQLRARCYSGSLFSETAIRAASERSQEGQMLQNQAVVTKDEILAAIRREAGANGGLPPGRTTPKITRDRLSEVIGCRHSHTRRLDHMARHCAPDPKEVR